jgi:hypothetical protein
VNLRVPLTQGDFGALVGVSQQAVAALIAAGVLREHASAAEWFLAYCAHIRASAAGRADDPDISAQRLRRAKAAADRAEMQNAVLRGELVKWAAIEDAYTQKIAASRDAFEALPDRVAANFAAESDPTRIHTKLREEIHLALTRLARHVSGPKTGTSPDEDVAPAAEIV